MTEQATGLAVRQTIVVAVPQERAFEVFTAGMTGWWPLQTHSIGSAPAVAAVLEPREGGRWYERGEDGSECEWGRVLAWDPPNRLVLSWEVSCDWEHDPSLTSEVDVRFVAQDGEHTRVELEHRGLETFGERAQEMRDTFDSPGGWPGLLQRFAGAADPQR